MAAIADRDSAKDLRGAGWDWTSKKAEQQREREKAADDVITDLGLVRKLRWVLSRMLHMWKHSLNTFMKEHFVANLDQQRLAKTAKQYAKVTVER